MPGCSAPGCGNNSSFKKIPGQEKPTFHHFPADERRKVWANQIRDHGKKQRKPSDPNAVWEPNYANAVICSDHFESKYITKQYSKQSGKTMTILTEDAIPTLFTLKTKDKKGGKKSRLDTMATDNMSNDEKMNTASFQNILPKPSVPSDGPTLTDNTNKTIMVTAPINNIVSTVPLIIYEPAPTSTTTIPTHIQTLSQTQASNIFALKSTPKIMESAIQSKSSEHSSVTQMRLFRNYDLRFLDDSSSEKIIEKLLEKTKKKKRSKLFQMQQFQTQADEVFTPKKLWNEEMPCIMTSNEISSEVTKEKINEDGEFIHNKITELHNKEMKREDVIMEDIEVLQETNCTTEKSNDEIIMSDQIEYTTTSTNAANDTNCTEKEDKPNKTCALANKLQINISKQIEENWRTTELCQSIGNRQKLYVSTKSSEDFKIKTSTEREGNCHKMEIIVFNKDGCCVNFCVQTKPEDEDICFKRIRND